MGKKIFILDSTLRDGAQAANISYSIEDKKKIVHTLDEIGIDYIEAGNPGSNPKDLEFLHQIKTLRLKKAKITAFGSTRRKGIKVKDDPNNQYLLNTDTPAVTIVGKSWDLHVKKVIMASPDENLDMIGETVAFFKKKDKEVIFDAEHFFDGFKSNPEYALDTLQAAVDGGADWLILCETNGGTFPSEVFEITKNVIKKFSSPVGIHCHNDCGMAVANSIMAVEAGATQVQGTFIGLGERCGNANLSTIIPNLQLKKDYECISGDQLIQLTSTARRVAEISNIPLDNYVPYVGKNAFAHKGGMHVDGVIKIPQSFEHVQPDKIGNERQFLMSEVSGRSTVLDKIQKVSPGLKKD